MIIYSDWSNTIFDSKDVLYYKYGEVNDAVFAIMKSGEIIELMGDLKGEPNRLLNKLFYALDNRDSSFAIKKRSF